MHDHVMAMAMAMAMDLQSWLEGAVEDHSRAYAMRQWIN
jgi:hypothetical protein